MLKKTLYIVVAVLICLNACQDDDHIIRSEGKPIYLSASLEGTSMTRSPYVPGGTGTYSSPTPETPLHTDVWASTTPYQFTQGYDSEGEPLDGSGDGTVAIHTDATFRSGDPQLLRAAIYPKENKPNVYFVAFSPISNTGQEWADEEGKYALYTFDGNDDVMFAPQVQGTYATDYDQSPTLSYHHLLTWLRVEMKAESKEVDDSWGKISEMTIKSNSKVKINLQVGAYDNGVYKYDEVSYYDKIDMPFYKTVEEKSYDGAQVTMVKKYTDDVFTNVEIPYLETEEMAYVLCAPVIGTDKKVENGVDVDAEEYVIRIITDKRTVEIPVNLRHMVNGVEEPFLGSTRCTQFTLTLNFKMGNTIYLTSSVKDWTVGGLIIGNIGDGNIQ